MLEIFLAPKEQVNVLSVMFYVGSVLFCGFLFFFFLLAIVMTSQSNAAFQMPGNKKFGAI